MAGRRSASSAGTGRCVGRRISRGSSRSAAGARSIDAAPVCHVSFYEADAFARYAGARLPTEAEWEVAAASTDVDGNLLDSGFLHPAAAADRRGGRRHSSTAMFGSGAPRPTRPIRASSRLRARSASTTASSCAISSSSRGGSCVTPADHIRATYRSFFYPHDRWQFLGFRLAKDMLRGDRMRRALDIATGNAARTTASPRIATRSCAASRHRKSACRRNTFTTNAARRSSTGFARWPSTTRRGPR